MEKQQDAPPRPCLRVLFGQAIALGPGKTNLLELIAETGSISAAARRMNMSYRRAWLLVDTMNQCFRSPLVETATGGKGGGGAQITELGQEILRRYREMERKAIAATVEDMQAISSYFSDTPPGNSPCRLDLGAIKTGGCVEI
jgi:molybdate transport system regulatory protein